MPPSKLHIETVQYTPGTQHMNIQYVFVGVHTGPLSGTKMFSTTQAKLAEVAAASGAPEGYWSDAEVFATLVEEVMLQTGIVAEIQPPEPPVPPPAESPPVADPVAP